MPKLGITCNHTCRLMGIGLLLAVLLILSLFAAACGGGEASPTATPTEPTAETITETSKKNLPDKIVAPHFINSYPLHGDILAQSPPEIVLNFNFNLETNSSISIARDGEPVSLGPLSISENQLSMRTPVLDDTRDGIYQVSYEACWPDRSCHEGSVSFTVDSATIREYEDLRGQSAVTIQMMDERRFMPARLIISPGTTLTWVNQADVAHFVNTDPHPSHNVLIDLNSMAVNPEESFSYTFDKPGAWGYHCSAHFNLGMIAQVIVK